MSKSPPAPALLEIYGVFLRISAVTIGGGYVMFPMLRSEVVEGRCWISDEEMIDYYALGQSVPGIIAMNTVTLIGYRKRGIAGAFVAAAGMATPSLVVILFVAAFLTPYFDLPLVQKAFSGIRAAVVAMIAMAVVQVARKSVDSVAKVIITIAVFLAIVVLHLHPVLMILSGCLLGLLLFRKGAAQS
ncbi:MAG: chromate transporter [Pontiellaceae bacterium]|nr:chromate transporter [Pontiellaceae bacterium]MBN2785070.1 chromate transporter [Pontiellaceae bacterium]